MCSCVCTASASRATCSARCAATAARNSKPPFGKSMPTAWELLCTCAATRVVASASATSCAPTACRSKGSTRSMPTSNSASLSTAASTASAPRSSSTWASPPCACSPTTPPSTVASKASVWRSSSGCRSRPSPTPRTSPICAPRRRAWGTCWRASMTNYEGQMRGDGLRVAIAASRFNDFITERLLVGAKDGLLRHGVDEGSITVAWAPGAFELPLVAQRLASSGEYDAVICVGAVIRGATGHYEHVAGQCAVGIARVQLDTGVPVIFGVLTTENVEQAIERAGTKAGNKGFESAMTAIEMADLLRQLPKSSTQ